MDLLQAAKERHSVRQYIDKPIDAETAAALQKCIDECNACGLHFQAVLNEPKAFGGLMARYGKFEGVTDYVALVADKNAGDEKIGYYGAKILLAAQTVGLNTCWVEMTYKKIKTAFVAGENEKLYGVIALGYGKTQGVAHKSKSASEVSNCEKNDVPEWFSRGVEEALLAPTAMNQQKFYFAYNADGTVTATTKGGFYTEIDLGIAKYFFELGTNKDVVTWKK